MNRMMKHLPLLLILTLLFPLASMGQSEAERRRKYQKKTKVEVPEGDTTIIGWREKKIKIYKEDGNTHVAIEDPNSKKRRYEEDYDREYEREREHEDEYEFEDQDDDSDEVNETVDTFDKVKTDFIAFDIGGVNYYYNGDFGENAVPQDFQDMQVRPYRFGSHVALHFFPTTASLIGRGAVNLQTALTLDISQFYYESPITLAPDQDAFVFALDSTANFKTNKLRTTYLQIPLMLEFDTSPRGKGLKFAVGGFAGIRVGSSTIQKIPNTDKIKVQDTFGLSDLRYGLTARFDLGWLDIYANYHLNSLFEEGKGPNTQTFSAGINLLDF